MQRSNLEDHEDTSNGSRVVPYGQTAERTDGHEEVNSRYSNFSNAPKHRFTFYFGNFP